jgi:hypothetical protein
MSLAKDDLEAQRQKAKHLAMLQALSMIERSPTQMCSSCADWQQKWSKDNRQNCQNLEHLRNAVQTMIDVLARYITESSLQELVESLQLDTRVFNVHSGNKCYVPKDGSGEKADMATELERVVAERDLAKMSLYKIGKELAETKEANQELDRQLAERDKDARQRQRRLDKAETRMQTLEMQSSCAGLLLDPAKLRPSSRNEIDASMPQPLQQAGRLSPQSPDIEAPGKMRRKIDGAYHSARLSKNTDHANERPTSSSARVDTELQRLDGLEERMAGVEAHGFSGRAPLPEVLANRPCKPPARMRPPKDPEVNIKDTSFSKSRRSRSHTGYLDSSALDNARCSSPSHRSALFTEVDRGIMGRGQSSQNISYNDHTLSVVEVCAHLSRGHSRSGF